MVTSRLTHGSNPADPPLQPVHLQQIELRGFWRDQVKRLTEKWIPHCIIQMEAGGRGQELMNLVHTGAILKGEPVDTKFTGCPWSDAYVYNTVESICLALAVDPAGDEALDRAQGALRKKVDEWIPIILAAQMDDGYIHSFHTVNKYPRYTNIRNHEFYVQGYFIEMGVAHCRITGGKDRRLYDAARKCADHLCRTFGPPPKRNWVYGHAGMGYALCRLARLVDEVEGDGKGDAYVRLAKYLFDHRHTEPAHRNAYHQSHLPVVEMDDAIGHAVRATYFYTGITELAMLTGDTAYRAAADKLWDSAVNRKLYITGGVGASHKGEAFDVDYELRNNGYCESCAGCGLSFWADRMHRSHKRGHYMDVQERVLYNNILGAIELSGENFYYQNPLIGKSPRYPWHGCPCCVGNIPRALIGIKDSMYSLNRQKDALYVSHFVASTATLNDVAGTSVRIEQRTDYPWKGAVSITLSPDDAKTFTVKVRVPDRGESALYTPTPDLAGGAVIKVNDKVQTPAVQEGYVSLKRTWTAGDRIDITLPMNVQRVHCDERAAANRGRVALQRGPLVYNVEDIDHAVKAADLVLKPDAVLTAAWRDDLLAGVVAVACADPDLLAIPNFARLNRGGESRVWIVEDAQEALYDGPGGHTREPVVRADLDARTIDKVVIGSRASENRHGMQGDNTQSGPFRGRFWRHAGNGGWFSYQLAVVPDAGQAVLCTYWGDDFGNRQFEIVVEGQVIGAQTLQRNTPGAFFDVEYPIPPTLVLGKEKVCVKLQAKQGATAGGVFDLRTVTRP